MYACVTYHDAVMYKATSMSRRSQVRILLGTGNSDCPDVLPGLVQVAVYRVDTGVVRRHGVACVDWNVVRLEQHHHHHHHHHHNLLSSPPPTSRHVNLASRHLPGLHSNSNLTDSGIFFQNPISGGFTEGKKVKFTMLHERE